MEANSAESEDMSHPASGKEPRDTGVAQVSQVSEGAVSADLRSYVFNGRVHPERYEIGIAGFPELTFAHSDGTWSKYRFQLIASQMAVQVQTNSDMSLLDLKGRVNEAARIAVDVLGYVIAAGLEVEIVTCVDHHGMLHVFNTAFDGLRAEAGPERNEREQQLVNQLASQSISNIAVRQALVDFRHAIREPADTAFNCYRAVEAIRQTFVSDSSDVKAAREVSWQRLRDMTGVRRPELNWLRDLATPRRHGEVINLSHYDRERALRIVRRVIEGYCASPD